MVELLECSAPGEGCDVAVSETTCGAQLESLPDDGSSSAPAPAAASTTAAPVVLVASDVDDYRIDGQSTESLDSEEEKGVL